MSATDERKPVTIRQKSGALLVSGAALLLLGLVLSSAGEIWCAICGGGVLMLLGALVGMGLLPVSATWGQAPAAADADANAGLKIGVIGCGHLGGAVGGLWVKAGYPVCFSSRQPEQLQELPPALSLHPPGFTSPYLEQLRKLVARLGPLARTGTVEQALAFGDVVLMAVPFGALPQIGKDYAKQLKGKIVLDASNALAERDGPVAGEAAQDGIGITAQKYLLGARLVRAFNTIPHALLESEAHRSAPRLAVPLAGDDAQALLTAAALVRDAGFDPVEVGKLADARRFQSGAPGYGPMTAAELEQKLS